MLVNVPSWRATVDGHVAVFFETAAVSEECVAADHELDQADHLSCSLR